jgi:hypothetical protein
VKSRESKQLLLPNQLALVVLYSYFRQKIRFVPLKDLHIRKIPLKDSTLEFYH